MFRRDGRRDGRRIERRFGRRLSLKISTKVALSFVVLVLLQGIVTLITLTTIISRSQYEAFSAQMDRTVSGIDGYLREMVAEQAVNANLLAGQAKVIDYTDFGLRNLLARELSVYRASLGMDALEVYTAPDHLFSAAGTSPGVTPELDRYVSHAMDGNEVVFVSPGQDSPRLAVLTPIERGSEIIGVLVLSRNLDADFTGTLQTFLGVRIILRIGTQTVAAADLDRDTVHRITATQGPSPGDESPPITDGYVVGSISMSGIGAPEGIIYCLLDTTEFRRQITRYNTISMVSTFLILSAALFVGIIFYRLTFYRPFQHVLEGVNRIADGNLTHHLHVGRDDEFGELVDAFNTMRENLKSREQELRQLSLYNTLILDNVSAGIVTVNLEKTITTINPAAARTLAVDAQEIVGREMTSRRVPEPLCGIIETALGSETYGNGREVVIQGHGEERTLSVSVSPLRSRENDKIGIIAIFEDITRMKRLEDRLAISSRLAALGEMAAGVAHQIRNPLCVMKVSAEMLRDDFQVRRNVGNYRRITHMVINEIDTLSLVIRNLLDFARPPEIQTRRWPVGLVVMNALDSLPLDRFPELTVETTGLETAADHEMDRSLIEQVVANLVLNAIQASRPDGRVRISAATRDGRLKIEVRDWGSGFDQSVGGNIFNPFFTTKSNGTGLGLSIVHRIIEQHHGTIDCRSRPGEGSTFLVTL